MRRWRARLEALERSRGERRHVLVAHGYGEPAPPVPAGCTATIVTEVVVLGRDPETGEFLVQDPWDEAVPLRVSSTDELPDRDPSSRL
ncbi:MAG TPA: hypothetical protein VM597_13660 [Gemmataceae bacterium]|nr:hypothetical protein [Gemmataceae bacterium]